MDSKSSTASVNISLNSGSERKLMQLIVEDRKNKTLFVVHSWSLIIWSILEIQKNSGLSALFEVHVCNNSSQA
jgi:hypothetical protein